jgi:ATP-dependent Clp protease ATP-binding subunit ClpA
MFERYTEKARRTIFFARYEASQYGSPYIEAEHILLGILREDYRIVCLLKEGKIESIRKHIDVESPKRKKVSTSVDLALSVEAQHVLSTLPKKRTGWTTSTSGRNTSPWVCFASKSVLPQRFCKRKAARSQICDWLFQDS